jgi:glycerol-3-phosphate dehydrogenase
VPAHISTSTLEAWLRNHGSDFRSLALLAQTSGEAEPLGGTDAVMAEVTHAVRREMAVRLQDVILRRTDMGSGAHPGRPAIEQTAHGMQRLMGWTDERRAAEVTDTERVLDHHRAAVPGRGAAGEING